MTQYMADSGLAGVNVSRETQAQLAEFSALVTKWNGAINLVSRTTIDQIWSRHVLDSVQVFDHGATASHWVDLGSGGGFPGIVVAILAKERAPHMRMTLVESDQRKAIFLRQASQVLGLGVNVISERIEAIAPLAADVLSARALAPLPKLCAFAARHLASDGTAIFQKGKSANAEITESRKDWHFSYSSHKSSTDPAAVVLVLKGIAHV